MNGLPPVGARHWERGRQGEFHFGKLLTSPAYQSPQHTTSTTVEQASISLVAGGLGSYLHATFIISFDISIQTNISAELLLLVLKNNSLSMFMKTHSEQLLMKLEFITELLDVVLSSILETRSRDLGLQGNIRTGKRWTGLR